MASECYFCGGTLKEQQTSVDFWWGEKLVIFEETPAIVCQQCGEKYFTSDIYRKMEDLARRDDKADSHITVNVIRFREESKT